MHTDRPTPPDQPNRARAIAIQIGRWTLASFLCLLAPIFYLLGIWLLVNMMGETEPPSAAHFRLFLICGLACLALPPGCLFGARFVVRHLSPSKSVGDPFGPSQSTVLKFLARIFLLLGFVTMVAGWVFARSYQPKWTPLPGVYYESGDYTGFERLICGMAVGGIALAIGLFLHQQEKRLRQVESPSQRVDGREPPV